MSDDKRQKNNHRVKGHSDNKENFIMLPTVDFCFKELMKNQKVRRGFIAAILGKHPDEIHKTTLMATELRKESEDDKLGILDVLVELEDGSQMNLEMQVPYFEYWTKRVLFYVSKIYTGQIRESQDYESLKKCIHVSILDFIHFPQDQNEGGVIRWMRFLGGKSRKEFEEMAQKDEYIEEAYDELKKLSLDEQKRMEYEQRQKAIRDYNSQMNSAERRGEARGEKRGEERGKQRTLKHLVKINIEAGKSMEEIAEFLGLGLSEVEKLAEEDSSTTI